MTKAAKREDSIEDNATPEIAADDPLFELSQIMGLDDEAAAEPSVNIDPQIDLEDALLAEMVVEPEIDAPSMATDDPAPTAESLEDELTTMLGGEVSVAAEVPAPDVEAEAAQAAISGSELVEEPEAFDTPDDELEAMQFSEAVADADMEHVEHAVEANDEAREEVAMPDAEPEAVVDVATTEPDFGTPFDAELENSDQVDAHEDIDAEPLEALEDNATLSLEEAEMELERDFAAFFDEELPDAELTTGHDSEPTLRVDAEDIAATDAPDPMNALADVANEDTAADDVAESSVTEFEAETSFQATFNEQAHSSLEDGDFEANDFDETEIEPGMASIADVEAVSSDIEQLNAGIEKIFGEPVTETDDTAEPDVPATAEPDVPAAPILETTDMSSYEAANATEVEVPELPDLENEFVAAFETDKQEFDSVIEDDGEEQSSDVTAAIGATVAAAGATVLSRRAGETAMAADDEAFDETRFEAELARDMEFVSHDLGNADDDGEALGQDFEDQAFAAQAAANTPNKRGLVIAAVLGCVAIVGVAGILFANSGADTSGSDGPVLVEASPDPVKIEPENPGGKLVPNQDRAVFAENAVTPEQEQLVPGLEEPVDIAAVPQADLPSSLNGSVDAQKGDDRLIPQATETSNAADEIGALIAPRRVRTLVVRPDGTLVERAVVPTPEPVVSTAEPVVSTPEPATTTPGVVAAIPEPVAPAPVEVSSAPVELGAAEETPSTTVIVPEAPGNDVVQAQSTEPSSEPVVAEVSEVPETTPNADSTAPETAATAVDQTETQVASVARTITNPPTIADRPKDQPLTIVNQPEAAPNTQVAAAPAVEQIAAASPTVAPFSVQLASLPSQAAAQNTANNLSRQYSNLIGNRALSIREAKIEGRGTFYRVRVGANSRADANQLCEQVKVAGGDCFVTR